MNKIITAVLVDLGFLVAAIGLSALLALPVLWLWNWLIPALFSGPEVTFLQAWGLCLLTHFLFPGKATK